MGIEGIKLGFDVGAGNTSKACGGTIFDCAKTLLEITDQARTAKSTIRLPRNLFRETPLIRH